jgi:hypothetical protein
MEGNCSWSLGMAAIEEERFWESGQGGWRLDPQGEGLGKKGSGRSGWQGSHWLKLQGEGLE